MADDIVVGSVAVDIVPDTRNFRRDLNAKLQGISVDIGVKADLAGVRADLDEATRPRDMKIVANAEVAEANAQLDEAARDRTSTIRANIDRSEVNSVGKMSGALGNIGILGTSIITLGPALIPILGTIAAIGLALGAPIAVAAGGATVFGFLAGFALKDTNKQLKAIDQARAKLGTLTKGTAAYSAAQADLKAKQDALTPAQKKYADALDHIKGTFASLLGGKVGDQLLGPVAAFLTLAAEVLPKLTPIIGAVSGALTTLIGDLGNSVKSPEFKSFLTAFTQQVGPDIVAFGRIAGNVFKGVAGLVVSLGNAFGPSVLKGLGSLAGEFADLGQQAQHSQKLQDFVDYFHRVGPQVGQTIGAVARAVGHVVAALAPLGPPVLKIVEGIANAIAGIPIPVLTALAASFVAMTAAAKISKGLSSLNFLSNAGGLRGGKGGLVGDLVGATKPVPVFVTNDGFGRGVGGGLATESKYLPFLAILPELATLLGAGIGVYLITKHIALPNIKSFVQATVQAQTGSTVGGNAPHQPSQNIPSLQANMLNPRTGGEYVFNPVTQGYDWIRFSDKVATKVDALKSSLAGASRQIDLIGPHAATAFGSASGDVAKFTTKLDAIHDKKIRVLLDDLATVQSLKALQAFRLHDKTLTIKVEQELERVVGPGGGAGRPTGPVAPRTSAPRAAPSSASGSGATGPLVNIQNANIADTGDLLRKSQDALIARAGGGVLLRPPATARFS